MKGKTMYLYIMCAMYICVDNVCVHYVYHVCVHYIQCILVFIFINCCKMYIVYKSGLLYIQIVYWKAV